MTKLKLWQKSSCNSSDSSDQKKAFPKKNSFHIFFFTIFPSFFLPKKNFTKKNSNTQIVMKLKNSNCDETQKLKLWKNSKTQIVIKLKNSKVTKLKKINLWQKSKTQIVTKAELWQNSICDKTQIVTKHKLWQKSIFD